MKVIATANARIKLAKSIGLERRAHLWAPGFE